MTGLYGIGMPAPPPIAEAPHCPTSRELVLRSVSWARCALETGNPVLVTAALDLLGELESRLITDELVERKSK